jgi:hypothetical protein
LPENFPTGPPLPAGPPPEAPPAPEEPAARRRRFSRNGILISLLALVVIAGLVLIGTAPKDEDTTGASATQSATTGPATSALAPAETATQSAKPSVSASASASPSRTTSGKTDSNVPSDRGKAGCGPHPSACGFPDASNTGVPAGTKLSVVNGSMTIKKAGTVVDGKDIRGCVSVEAPHVTIRRSKITCPNFYGILSDTERYSGGGLQVQDVTVSCGNAGGTGIGSYGLTAVRVNISGCENGFDIDNTVTVKDSYVHDPYSTEENHADGAQLNVGSHIQFLHNTIFMPQSTSAIISNPSGNTDVLISDNLMSGGAYTLYCPRDHTSDYRVLNNRISTVAGPKGGAYGPWTDCDNATQVSGNVWDATLKPLGTDD